MNLLTLTADGHRLNADLDRAFDLSIPLAFNGEQPAAFDAPPADAAAYRNGGFIGDVAQGGSCNCATYRLTPHCNGTHTECVGHITRQAVDVNTVFKGGLEPALVLTVATLTAEDCFEDTDPSPQPRDRLITAQAIEAAWKQHQWTAVTVTALVLRTLPNDAGKRSRRYEARTPPSYLTRQAVTLLVDRGIQHLLIDVPSLDRMDDGGKLTGHRLFWGMPPGGTDAASATRPRATITEFIFVPDEVHDGRYLLALQLAPFVADAAPSRPIVYPVIE